MEPDRVAHLLADGGLTRRLDREVDVRYYSCDSTACSSGQDTLKVAAATTYMFDASIHLTIGVTSRTPSFGFGGSATFTRCTYLSNAVTGSAGSVNTPSMHEVETASAAVILGAATGCRTRMHLVGSFQVNAAGTVIPQITFSADHTGPLTTNIGSFFRRFPIGTNTVTSVRAWG
jgi:hypothetical protein